ncbi:hypothetical protein AlacWU_06419 [Aspergillus niger]|nr:hypothetical protein AlacWU_06419 [Aspergillus niger]
MFSIFFLPESPRWLVQKGRLEQARATLVSLSGASAASEDVSGDIAAIQLTLENHSRGLSIMDIWRPNDEKLLYRFSLCILLQFYQQMSGADVTAHRKPYFSLRSDYIRRESSDEQHDVENTRCCNALMEVPLMFRGFLLHRSVRPPHGVHRQRNRNVALHAGLGHHHELSACK